MTADRPIYIDIDGTLTDRPDHPWGAPIAFRIAWVKTMIEEGKSIVLWSGTGTAYVRAFAEQHGLGAAVCIGKPEMCIDDNPGIRPEGRMRIVGPVEFFGE